MHRVSFSKAWHVPIDSSNVYPGFLSMQTPKLYCGGDTSDLTEVLQHLQTKIGGAPLVAVAMSMGRLALIKVEPFVRLGQRFFFFNLIQHDVTQVYQRAR